MNPMFYRKPGEWRNKRRERHKNACATNALKNFIGSKFSNLYKKPLSNIEHKISNLIIKLAIKRDMQDIHEILWLHLILQKDGGYYGSINDLIFEKALSKVAYVPVISYNSNCINCSECTDGCCSGCSCGTCKLCSSCADKCTCLKCTCLPDVVFNYPQYKNYYNNCGNCVCLICGLRPSNTIYMQDAMNYLMFGTPNC